MEELILPGEIEEIEVLYEIDKEEMDIYDYRLGNMTRLLIYVPKY